MHAADSGCICAQIVVLAAGYDTRAYRLKSGVTQVSRMRPSLLHRMLSLPRWHSHKTFTMLGASCNDPPNHEGPAQYDIKLSLGRD